MPIVHHIVVKTENILLIFGHLDVLFINKLIEIHNSPLKIFYKINKICIIHINDNDNYYQLKRQVEIKWQNFSFQFISSVFGELDWANRVKLVCATTYHNAVYLGLVNFADSYQFCY